MTQIVTSEEAFLNLIKSNKKVLIDFYADWCGPCQMMAPFFEEISNENHEVVFAKVNVDHLENLSKRFQITSIPTLIFFVDGNEIGRKMGFQNKELIADFIK
ncbi:thioredoxin [Mycoplasmoides alvi]|uniref:thioredoxin n=1 Tax=Mycoplasmoides alvi TaxID=78580 RepID=UPI00051BB3A5|nr:thioredoxin [Mycoplasmoides alvi]